MKRLQYFLFISFISLLTIFSVTACQKPTNNVNTLIVGTISGPETELMEVAKEVALKKYNLNIKIVEFNDYSQPNAALQEGSLDANAFQHKQFLDNEIKNKGYELVAIAKTFVYPMAIYSQKIKNISEITAKSIVAIPNDVSNEARSLILLSKAKLIDLQAGTDLQATPKDIINNPKELQFKELDAAQLPRVLPDVTLSVINSTFAFVGNLSADKQAIFVEDKTSPYVNLIVARKNSANDPRLKQFINAFQSQEVVQKAKELFKGHAIAGW